MILRDRFGSTIGRLRVARGLSQEKLAHLSGLHATTISAIERGKMSVTLETLEGLAGGLDISSWELVRLAATGEAETELPQVVKPARSAEYGAGSRQLKFSIVAERTSAGYSAYCPDLPGCTARGESRAEVERAMRETITAQIQSLRRAGNPIPESVSYTTVVSVDI